MNRMTDVGDTGLLQEAVDGVRRVERRVFTCPELFEREFSLIWEKVWVYLAHESQIRNPGDFITGWIGRVPVVLNRNRAGRLGAFVNVCSHRGATLCRVSKGHAADFTCPFHGWSFDLDGRLLAPMAEDGGGYPVGFDKERLGLRRVRLESYRGFLFGTLDDGAEPLTDYLAESKIFIDLLVDQSPDGIEVLKGRSTYTFEGNWKLQAENGVDGYHVGSVHANYTATLRKRARSNSPGEKVRAMNVGDIPRSEGGAYDLGHGHTMIWSDWSNPKDRPIHARKDQLIRDLGADKTDWVIGRLRNLLLYPNVFLMDQMSSQIRMFRPLTVNRTEVTIYCFGPIGEAVEEREKRIRQYEDFFNASGMATPDDLTEFEEAHKGCRQHRIVPFNEMSRGAAHERRGADERARRLGIRPLLSSPRIEDEGILFAQHRRWAELMAPALDGAR